MRILSHHEFVSIFEDASIRIASDGKVHVNTSTPERISWDEAVNYVWFAKRALETITSSEQVLFFHEYGIWPSSENRYLFTLTVKALFDVQAVNPTQYFQFSASDREAAQTLLQIGLQSGWGGLMLGSNNNWFYFSHDQLGMIESTVNVSEKFDFPGMKVVRSI